jgi:tetraacyldisaccharide 4'-kinase
VFNPTTFRAIASGEDRGLAASFVRCGLRILETPYTWEVQRRNRAFDTGRKTIHRAGVPVISVGNLTLGGTGKTPLVAWLAGLIADRGVHVAIVSRGYGSKAGAPNDEALELANRLPAVPHLQNPNRVEAAATAIREHGAQLIVLDDGFQHRRLARDLDIVLLDALEPFGFDHVFPRGMLREPVEGLARADVIALSRADAVDDSRRRQIRQMALRFAADAVWVEVAHRPTALVNSNGEMSGLDMLAGRRIAAFCGIGNPAGFRHTLEACGCALIAWKEFPDHFNYGRGDIDTLQAWTAEAECDCVVCTQKDLVKLNVERLGKTPLRAVQIDIELLAGKEELLARIESLLPAAN